MLQPASAKHANPLGMLTGPPGSLYKAVHLAPGICDDDEADADDLLLDPLDDDAAVEADDDAAVEASIFSGVSLVGLSIPFFCGVVACAEVWTAAAGFLITF